jgi:hypothetical protein
MTIGTWGPHAAGTSIDLSADPFPCDGSYGSGHTYRATLVVTPPDRTGARFDLGSFPVARDGSFATSLRLPPDAPAGRAVLNLRGSTYDRCDDGNSACPGYESPGFAVTG